MDARKQKRLEAAGWNFGNAEDFLGMTPEEAAYLNVKLTLAREVEAHRQKAGLSQTALAARMKTRQPNITRLERKPEHVTIDALFKTLLALGLSPRKIAACCRSELVGRSRPRQGQRCDECGHRGRRENCGEHREFVCGVERHPVVRKRLTMAPRSSNVQSRMGTEIAREK